MPVSVIIPTLNEGERIGPLIRSLRALSGEKEIIVADGGSADNTVEEAENLNALVVHALSGRASQMNAGARAAAGDILWFLHADSVPAPSSIEDIGRVIGPSLDGGYWLIGMRRFIPEIFDSPAWGGGDVLRATLEQLKNQEVSYRLIDALPDIDTPEDFLNASQHLRYLSLMTEAVKQP